jgi:hypothetical protein
VQPQNPNLGNAQIVLNTHAEATFQIPDVTKVLAVPDLLQVYMQPAVVAIAESIETSLLNLFAGFTANTPVGTPGTPLVEAVIDQAESALFTAKVPPSEPKYLVVDAATYSALRQIERFSEFQTAGEAGLRALIDGAVGKIKDFFVMRSQYVAYTGSSPHDDSQHRVHEARDRSGDPATAAAAVRHGRGGALRGNGQLRHARGDELPAEYAGAAVHGGRAVRLRGDPEQLRRTGECVAASAERRRNKTNRRGAGPYRPHKRQPWTYKFITRRFGRWRKA